MNSSTPPKSVLETILAWSAMASRPLWQRDALRRIILEGKPDDAAMRQLLDLCKRSMGPKVSIWSRAASRG